jgi:hypothetical protein
VHGLEELAVVETVSVAVCAAVPLSATGLVVPKLNVGGADAFVGADVTTAPRLTLPMNPPTGVMVIVDVLPEVAPGATVTFVPLIVKLGPAVVETATDPVPIAVLKVDELFESGA